MRQSNPRASACAPPDATLTRRVSPVARSWTKTSSAPFVSCGDEIPRSRAEADEAPVAAHHAAEGRLPGLDPGRGDVHALGAAVSAVADEHVGSPVPVAVRKVSRERPEPDDGPSASIEDASLRPTGSPYGPTLTRVTRPVARSAAKTSSASFRSSATRFEALRGEDDDPAVGTEERREAARVRLPGAVLAHPRRRAGVTVAHEDVLRAIRVARHEVRSPRTGTRRSTRRR